MTSTPSTYDEGTIARQLHADTGSVLSWDDLDAGTRTGFLIRACEQVDRQRREAREEAARQVKVAALNTYRREQKEICNPSQTAERVRGFADGWDAAMAHIAARQGL